MSLDNIMIGASVHYVTHAKRAQSHPVFACFPSLFFEYLCCYHQVASLYRAYILSALKVLRDETVAVFAAQKTIRE